MTDKKLLEFAAKAVGIELQWLDHTPHACFDPASENEWWNPLTDDGDALRILVSLKIGIEFGDCIDNAPVIRCGTSYDRDLWVVSANFPDQKAATRRAITCAAAEIGKAMTSAA